MTRKPLSDIIREIFLRPRAVYEADEVMRMLGVSDRLFADIVDDVELRGNKGGYQSV